MTIETNKKRGKILSCKKDCFLDHKHVLGGEFVL